MITPDRIQRLQEVANYRTVHKILRGSAIGSMVFGALALAGGVVPPIEPILIGVGVVLVGTGLWNFFSPRPTGIIVDGLTLVMVGIYNLASAFMSAGPGGAGGGNALFVKLGIFQVVWGVQSFWRFVQFRDAFKAPATGAELLEVDGLARDLWKTRTKESSDTIEFVVSAYHAKKWKARLEPEVAVLATERGREVRFCRRDELAFEDTGKVMLSKNRKVKVRLGAKEYKAHMSPESLDRFNYWKTGVSIPRPIAA